MPACKSCGCTFAWKRKGGKWHAIDVDGSNHWSHCRSAATGKAHEQDIQGGTSQPQLGAYCSPTIRGPTFITAPVVSRFFRPLWRSRRDGSSTTTRSSASAANQADSSETWTTTGLSAPVKQKIAVTFTPQEKGLHRRESGVGEGF